MHAELIAIGSELTSGHTVNTNAASLARWLGDLGIPCARVVAVSDEPAAIQRVVQESIGRAPLIIITGGLGPTFDDVTMATLAQTTGRPFVFNPQVACAIRAFCRRHQRRATTLALRQAYVPQGAATIPNPLGTAPGVWLRLPRCLVIALPGVPREMSAMMTHSVLPRLRRLVGSATPFQSRTIRTVGLVELDIQRILQRLKVPAIIEVGLYPHLQAVDVRLTGHGPDARSHLARLERNLRGQLGEAVYGFADQTLETVVGAALVRRRQTLALAESCTGGVIADRLPDVPGSSRYLLVGIIAYHNRAKELLLGVPRPTLLREGAVSASVARAMANGVRRRSGADIGMAVTGIAGPTGGSARKPVGLVYIAIADSRRVEARAFRFHGDRVGIKQQTAQRALHWLWRWVAACPR